MASKRQIDDEDDFGGDYTGRGRRSGEKRSFGDLDEEEEDVFGSKKEKKGEESGPGATTGMILSLRESLKNCKDNLATCQLLFSPGLATMIPTPLYSGVPPELPTMQPVQSPVSSFWDAATVSQHLRNLQDTVNLAKALQKELEEIHSIRQSSQNNASSSYDDVSLQISEMLKEQRISLYAQQSLSMEAAHSLISTLRDQLVPFSAITSETSSWEQRSMAVRLAQKLQKAKRNKRWKKKKRKHVAELLRKEHEVYAKADQDADEWRAREIAKDIARRKVESMKTIAKLKAKEERKRLESELELVLVVEKLQELRSIRIRKLKKQGHFLPEEDDKFLERVRAAVEDEERQAAAAADTDAAKDAIVTAEVSRKTILGASTGASDVNFNKDVGSSNHEYVDEIESERSSGMNEKVETDPQKCEEVSAKGYDPDANLPFEFYHYYHGSSNDMGTLIEVRRTWDAYIRPGGSRIPGHWVQPPQPADEVWASHLIGPK